MGRLTTLKPSVNALPSHLGFARDRHGHSKSAEPWRKWYNLARWKRMRLKVFLRDLYQCQIPSCGIIEFNISKLVADHKRRHHGNPNLFWDETNVWTLCKTCHDTIKQREERDPRQLILD